MFLTGSLYSRKDIGFKYFPNIGRPKGGSWDTGYVRVKNHLVIFMNIDVEGRTGHDFDNRFDNTSKTIIWFGKPDTNSKQPTFAKLIDGDLVPHFFARWDNKDPKFAYLGVGELIRFENGILTKNGKGEYKPTIQMEFKCLHAEQTVRNFKEMAKKLSNQRKYMISNK